MDDFITKPVNKAELLLRVRSQLQVALLQEKHQRLLAELRRIRQALERGAHLRPLVEHQRADEDLRGDRLVLLQHRVLVLDVAELVAQHGDELALRAEVLEQAARDVDVAARQREGVYFRRIDHGEAVLQIRAVAVFCEALADIARSYPDKITVEQCQAIAKRALDKFEEIPAVVAFNRYSHDIDRLAIRFESFIEEFTNILQRKS